MCGDLALHPDYDLVEEEIEGAARKGAAATDRPRVGPFGQAFDTRRKLIVVVRNGRGTGSIRASRPAREEVPGGRTRKAS